MGAFDIDYPRALLAALTVVLLFALVLAGATSSAAFGAFNPSWDGASALQDRADAVGVDAEIVRETSELGSVPSRGSVAVILSPDRPYTSADIAEISSFLEGGGTLLVAEDYGKHTNDLLSRIGVEARIDGTPLRDERNYYRSPAFPVAANVSNHSLTAGVSRLTLNHGTVVRPGNATVLVNSSSFSYLDTNRDGELDDDETIRRHPVATVERVGNGRVVVVSDPSVFINVMLKRAGNAAFVRNVFAGSERVLIDTSHTADVPPLVQALLIIRESSVVQLVVGLCGLGAVAFSTRGADAVIRIRDRFRRSEGELPEFSTEELTTTVEARHPDWDPERVRRVVRRMERSDDLPWPKRNE